jgi:hypothetical protein
VRPSQLVRRYSRRFALLLERIPQKATPESMVGIWDSSDVLVWVFESRVLPHGSVFEAEAV